MTNLKIQGDRVIWVIAIIFLVFSLLVVYSSTGLLGFKIGNTEYFLVKQVFIVTFGLMLMYIVHLFNFKYFSRIAQMMLFIAIPLLILTMIFAPNENESFRNLRFNVAGHSLSFQPFDFAKLALIMFIARYLAKNKDESVDPRISFLTIILPILVVCGLILRSNLSTAAILFFVSFILLYVGKVRMKYLLTFMGIGAGFFVVLITISLFSDGLLPRVETWTSRIEGFVSSVENEELYQVQQSKIAVATGGLIGKMPGNSTQRNFLPQPYNDYVYAIIVEEYGILGGITVIFLYMILFFRSIKIARKCELKFGSYLVFGISFLMVLQALINMGVAVDLLPVTGQTLPFLSMGGTSLWFSCIGLGIILSVSKNIKEQAEEVPANVNYATA